jgi:hypothetical protein
MGINRKTPPPPPAAVEEAEARALRVAEDTVDLEAAKAALADPAPAIPWEQVKRELGLS